MSRLAASAVLAVAALVLAASAYAQVYKWKDANGTTHYSDAPPTGSSYQKVQISSNVATPVTPAPIPSVSATPAAAQPATASNTRVPDNADNRAKLCKDLNNNITLLSGTAPLTAGDSGAPQQNMSGDQRRQELATAQAQKAQYCAN